MGFPVPMKNPVVCGRKAITKWMQYKKELVATKLEQFISGEPLNFICAMLLMYCGVFEMTPCEKNPLVIFQWWEKQY